MGTEEDKVNNGVLITLFVIGSAAMLGGSAAIVGMTRTQMDSQGQELSAFADHERVRALDAAQEQALRDVKLPIDEARKLMLADIRRDPRQASFATPIPTAEPLGTGGAGGMGAGGASAVGGASAGGTAGDDAAGAGGASPPATTASPAPSAPAPGASAPAPVPPVPAPGPKPSAPVPAPKASAPVSPPSPTPPTPAPGTTTP